jgi:hypothetical protein
MPDAHGRPARRPQGWWVAAACSCVVVAALLTLRRFAHLT